MRSFRIPRKSIIVADTDSDTPLLMKSWLSDHSLPVIHVTNTDDAFRAFLENSSAAILIDALLPSKGGIETMEKIRRAKGGESANLYLLNALRSSTSLEKEATGRLNAVGILRKPLVKEQVLDQLEKVTSRYIEKAAAQPQEILSLTTPAQGDFRQTELPSLISGIINRRESCQFIAGSGKTRKIATFKDGRLVFCVSNLISDTLGRHLVTAYGLDSETYRKAVDTMIATKKRTGEILIDMGVFDSGVIDKAVVTNILEKFLDIFRWRNGWFRVQAYRDPPVAMPGEPIEGPHLIWDSIWEHIPEQVCEEMLRPHAHRTLYLASDDVEWASEMPTNIARKNAVRWARKLHGSTLDENVSELKKRKSLMTCLYLLLRGHLRFAGDIATGYGKKGNPAWEVDTADLQLAEARDFLEDLTGLNHFQALGVGLNCTRDDLKKRFHHVAALYHPDTLGDDAQDELRQAMSDIFAIYSEANQVLSDPETKEKYRAEIEVANAISYAEKELQAEAAFQKGLDSYQKGAYEIAVKAFKEASDFNPNASDYIMYLGLATLRTAKPDRAKATADAVMLFKKAQLADPNNPAPLVELGRAMMSLGEEGKAMAYFVRALHIAPNDKNILRQLKSIQSRSSSRFGKKLEEILTRER